MNSTMKSEIITLEDFLKTISTDDPITFFAETQTYSGNILDIKSDSEEINFLITVPDIPNNFNFHIKKTNALLRITSGRDILLASSEKNNYTAIIIPLKP
jgi:hypothetical protein